MKILVTGGAGFIASHVADTYIKAGHKVAIVDNLLTGFRKNLNPKAKFYKADIKDLAAMEKIFTREKPNIVSHHAAIAEVVKSLKNPIPTFETNVIGTANVLVAFGKHGARGEKRFIFSSTGGAIYGEPEKIPADENTSEVPLSPYGLSKLLDEEVIRFYSRQYNLTPVIFRYPNIYGPRQNPKGEAGVIAIFGGIMKHGAQPIIFGDGTKTRDYVYVGDIARANLLALKKGGGLTMNLGSGKETSDQMIFDAIAKEIGFTKKPIYLPFRKGEVYKIAITGARAKKVLGWKAKIALQKGIRETLETI